MTAELAYPETVAVDGAESSLVLAAEAPYVRETATGLSFRLDTPLEVWGRLVERLIRQEKRIHWALADAINFGEHRYGELYAQYVDETGLRSKTLANIAYVGRQVEASRRREDVSFSHHAEVASLPALDQEALLESAEEQGWSRYDLRDAARARREALRGRAVDVAGTPVPEPELVWVPTIEDLTPEARAALEANAPGGRHRVGYVAGFLRALLWADQRDAFREWRGPA